MKALMWQGINKLAVRQVPDPGIMNAGDMIVKVDRSVTCGSDLHLLGGDMPFMQAGDILGHEFVGEVVEIGSAVRNHIVGDRVVVASYVSCGRCWYCKQGLYSCCDNGNTNPTMSESMYGFAPTGGYGYSHAMGGFVGSHADYVRVPYADFGAFRIPDGVSYERALFASDAAPAGWMAADVAGVRAGDIVAVWGAGAVGQMAARAAMLLGAYRVFCIDRYDYRLDLARRNIGCETLNYDKTDVSEELLGITAGRGADVCIEAVGMQPNNKGPTAVQEAIFNCRKGGSVFILGVFSGFVDAFPLGAVINKGLTIRAAQQHGQRYIPMLLQRMQLGELVTEHLATHTMSLDEAPNGYTLFKDKKDGCLRSVFTPGMSS